MHLTSLLMIDVFFVFSLAIFCFDMELYKTQLIQKKKKVKFSKKFVEIEEEEEEEKEQTIR